MKIARLYLEDDDPIQAEAFINRASHLQVFYFLYIYYYEFKLLIDFLYVIL